MDNDLIECDEKGVPVRAVVEAIARHRVRDELANIKIAFADAGRELSAVEHAADQDVIHVVHGSARLSGVLPPGHRILVVDGEDNRTDASRSYHPPPRWNARRSRQVRGKRTRNRARVEARMRKDKL